MDNLLRVSCLSRIILEIISDNSDRLHNMYDDDIEKAADLNSRLLEDVLIEEDCEEEVDYDEGYGDSVLPESNLTSLLSEDDALEIQGVFQELSFSEGLGMLPEDESMSIILLQPKQLRTFIDIVNFFEALSGFEALKDLIAIELKTQFPEEEIGDDEREVVDSWDGFKTISFEIRELILRALFVFLDFYMQCEVDLASSPFLKDLRGTHKQFDMPRKCCCGFLSIVPRLSQQAEISCLELIKRIGDSSDRRIEYGGDYQTLSIEELSSMLPKATEDYLEAVKRVCTC